MNRTRIKSHLQYSWCVYLIILAAAIVIWRSIFSHLAKPEADEILNITLVGEFETDTLAEDLTEALEGKTARPLKEVNIEVISGENEMLADIITMRCLGETDLIIFEEGYLMEPMSSDFGPLDAEGLKTCFPGAVFYEEEGDILGMCLYDGRSRCRFSGYYSGDQSCWVFPTTVSENMARLNGKGTKENDAAIQAMQYLMESE